MASPEMAMLGGREETKSGSANLQPQEPPPHGISFRRLFTTPGVHPFDRLEWELRTAAISNEKGEVIFEQKDVEVPKPWSMTATNVVVSKYFHGKIGSPQRETSVRQLVD